MFWTNQKRGTEPAPNGDVSNELAVKLITTLSTGSVLVSTDADVCATADSDDVLTAVSDPEELLPQPARHAIIAADRMSANDFFPSFAPPFDAASLAALFFLQSVVSGFCGIFSVDS